MPTPDLEQEEQEQEQEEAPRPKKNLVCSNCLRLFTDPKALTSHRYYVHGEV